MPKLSVIMSSYNQDNYTYLQRSVCSLLDQSFSDFELLICDDGSSEACAGFLRSVSKLDPRIRLIGYRENRGLAYALNYCLRFARGTLVARQDDDDYSHRTRFATQMRFLESNPNIAFVGCACELIDEQDHFLGVSRVIAHPTSRDFLWNSPFAHPTIMMRTDALRSVGGYRVGWDTLRGQDYDLFMRMFSRGYLGENLEDALYTYCVPGGKMRRRRMWFRVGEASIRLRGYTSLGLMPGAIPYVVKPLLLGLLPARSHQATGVSHVT